MRELQEKHPIEQEELMAFLDGELSADRAASAAAHLVRCRECQSLAADLQGVSERLRVWQVESPDRGIAPAIATALDGRKRRNWWVAPLTLGFAGLLAAVLLISPQMNRRSAFVDHNGPQASFMQVHEPERVLAKNELVRTKNPLIVRTARLTLATKEFDKARAAIEEILKRHLGYFGQLNANSPSGAGRVLEATLRVPSDQLEAVMTELKKLGRVESETQGGEEVTQQYTDLEARLSNARNTEKRLTDLLRERTGKLADVLSVEMEINRTRGEIERMEAEKKNLASRVDFATLEVKLVEGYKAELQVVPDSTFTRFRNAAVEGYRTMVEGIVSVALILLSYGPSIMIWAALLFFPARFLWKRWRRA